MKNEAALFALVLASGCHKTAATVDAGETPAVSASADMAASVAPDDADAGPETLAAPAAVVQADANIPINEAVVGTPTNLPVDYFADKPPPPQAVVETQPAQPDSEDTWVPGYWWWSRPLARYVWVGGAWRRPPQDQVWVAGSWTPHGARYAWTPGYWGPRGYAREMIDVAPPPARFEVRPVSPGAEFVWTPGFYAHHGGAYAWTAGTWTRPPRAGVMWVEPRYVVTGGRYFLQPGRWDAPVERRGVVYAPDINARPGVRVVLAPVAANVVVEHARFVNESSRAVAHGVVRSENGSFVVPRAVVRERIVEHVEAPRVDVRVEGHDGHDGREVRVDQRVDPRVEAHVEPRADIHVDQRVHVEEHVAAPRGHVPEARVETHVEVPRPQVQVQVQQQQQHPPQTNNARPNEREQRHR